VAAVVLAASSPAAAQDDFYAGKQLTYIVGSGVGGGYHVRAHMTGRYLSRHIPGNPKVVVQNMPAAGSMAATNYIFNQAPRDGTAIAMIQRGMLLARLTNASGVRFELEKLNWIGSLNSETAVTFVWNAHAPHRTAKDLFERELIVGGVAGVDPETTPRFYNALLGTKFKIVTGYNSTAQIILAVERGEVHGMGDWSWSTFKSARPHWLRDKQVTLLMQGALQRDQELKDLPNALDFVKDPSDRRVLELHFTQKTAARPLIMPPGVPPERVEIMRRAFASLMQDKEFLAEAEKTRTEYDLVSADEVNKIVTLIASTPGEIAERYTKAHTPQ
jgi:tripartite-type tricarboxylate transporter receptor subunit TctC